MRIDTIKKYVLAVALVERLSFDHSESDLLEVLRSYVGRVVEHDLHWPGSEWYPEFSLKKGQVFLPRVVYKPEGLKHPFGCGPNEGRDQLLQTMKWAICVAHNKRPDQNMWTLYRINPQAQQEADILSLFPPVWNEIRIATTSLLNQPDTDCFTTFANTHYLTKFAYYIVNRSGSETAAKTVAHLIDFGLTPSIALTVTAAAAAVEELLQVDILNQPVQLLYKLKNIDIHEICSHTENADNNIGSAAFEQLLRAYAPNNHTPTIVPHIFNHNNQTAIQSESDPLLASLWDVIESFIDQNRRLQTLAKLLKFAQQKPLQPKQLANELARCGLGIKFAEAQALGIAELHLTQVFIAPVLRIMKHEEAHTFCWVNQEEAIIKASVEGFSTVKFFKPQFRI